MNKIKLNILGLSYSQTQTGAYALVLAEEDGDRRIPIIIGAVEAQSIAIQLEGLKPPRPLTHDLFLNMALAFGIEVIEVVIYKLEEGIFYSEIICQQNSQKIRIDSRTSDAVALALRFRAPVYCTPEILEKAGIVLDLEDENTAPGETEKQKESPTKEPSKTPQTVFSSLTIEELEKILEQAIGDEDYERASKVRDELKRRGNE